MINYENRITSDNIVNLRENEVFVFGSNEGGKHGRGAAATAHRDFGAEYGLGFGFSGQTFAIPTKNRYVSDTLPLHKISDYIRRFGLYAQENPDKIFLLTEIGCGLAGLKVEDVAPLCEILIYIENIHMPLQFWECLEILEKGKD
jgi:hypothetical protein